MLFLSALLSGCIFSDKPEESSATDETQYPPIWDRHTLEWDTTGSYSLLLEPGPHSALEVQEAFIDVDTSEVWETGPAQSTVHLSYWLPNNTVDGEQVPVIAVISPYFSYGTQGSESSPTNVVGAARGEFIFENFVPHGYAFAQVAVFGTEESTGCFDYRGHGESEKTDHGYRISRFAQDVQELLEHLQLGQVTLLGHSMGASVIWAFLDVFGSDQLSGIVIDDQSAAMTLLEDESQSEIENAGAIFPWDQLNQICASLKSPDADQVTRSLMDNMLSDQISSADRDWIMAENLKFPRHHAATLLFNHSTQDWRDLIMRIQIPTLIIGGESSVVPEVSQRWIHSQIPNSLMEIFPTDAGGHHFAFLENG